MRQVVYLDEIIIVNLVMNLTVLWLTSRFTGSRTSPTRMLTAVTVGCIYALLIFFPGLDRAGGSIVPKTMVAGLMILIAFGFGNFKSFLKNILGLFLASFFVGGISLGLHYLFTVTEAVPSTSQQEQQNFNKWVILSCAVLLTYLVGKWGSTLWTRRLHQKTASVPVTVSLWGSRVSAQALVDTGNQLIDPISQHPVIVMEFGVLEPALPTTMCHLFREAGHQDGSRLMLLLADTPYAKSLRLIPFHSLGEENGMLLGIRPDAVEILYENRKYLVKDVVVGIYSRQLSPESAYRALLHPQLVAS